MRVGRDVDGGFEILDEGEHMIGAAYLDEKTGRIDVFPAGFHGHMDQLPAHTQRLQEFAEAEFRRRAAAKP